MEPISRSGSDRRGFADSQGRTIWIANAHCGDGKRFVVRAGQEFVELESSGGISKRRIRYSTKLFTPITSAGTEEPARLGNLALSYVGN